MQFTGPTLLIYWLVLLSKGRCNTYLSDEKFCRDADSVFGNIQKYCNKESENVITGCDEASKQTAIAWYGTGGVFNMLHQGSIFRVYCDMKTDGGKWLVFQRRKDGSINFYRNWKNYVRGFGDTDGEFWLGLDKLYKLTSTGHYELRIDMEDFDGNRRFAKYSTFFTGSADLGYKLSIKGYYGDAGDSLTNHNGMKFSTLNKDSDRSNKKNCAAEYKGGWWYADCHSSNLNGLYVEGGQQPTYADGINWKEWKGFYYSLKFVEMKIRKL